MWWDLHNYEDNSQNNSPTSLYGWRNLREITVCWRPETWRRSTNRSRRTMRSKLHQELRPARRFSRWWRQRAIWSCWHSYANLAANGSLRLLVINESVSNNMTATIGLTGFIPTNATAAAVRYGKIEDLANADLTTTNFTNIATNFTATFPAYSMTAITITGLKATTYAGWRAANFSGANATNDSVSGVFADPNQDGIQNLLAYAMNLGPQVIGTNGLPVSVIEQNTNGNHYLTLTYTRTKAATDVSCFVQVTGGLPGGWTTNGVVQVDQLVDQGATQLITARDTVPIGAAASRFLRLQVSQP